MRYSYIYPAILAIGLTVIFHQSLWAKEYTLPPQTCTYTDPTTNKDYNFTIKSFDKCPPILQGATSVHCVPTEKPGDRFTSIQTGKKPANHKDVASTYD